MIRLEAQGRAAFRATLSHMRVNVRELRNRTSEVVAAVQAGETVTLSVRGEPLADIVPHRRRSRWLPGSWLAEELRTRSADPGLSHELDELVGETVDDLR